MDEYQDVEPLCSSTPKKAKCDGIAESYFISDSDDTGTQTIAGIRKNRNFYFWIPKKTLTVASFLIQQGSQEFFFLVKKPQYQVRMNNSLAKILCKTVLFILTRY